jgi:hypothetical protein
MPVDRVILVHGYSVRQLSAYGQFPRLFSARGIPNTSILLSAFLSLDDDVTCDDLADALEDHVATQIEGQGSSINNTAIVCHSTGAIVARRWILNRAYQGKALPSHLITLAGANHGSTLAQLGRTILSKIYFGVIDQSAVGERVLADLDYGSDFLWRLNTEWMDGANGGKLNQVRCFSLGGASHSELIDQVFWQTKEAGSDSTVRTSGANLNYSVVRADPDATPPSLTVETLRNPVPHLILPSYTHSGIIGGVQTQADPPFAAVLQALVVDSDADYQAVLADWSTKTQNWTTRTPDEANATIVFRLRGTDGRPISDNLILLQDQQRNAVTVSPSLEPHQPIQNQLTPSSVSFYVNVAKFMNTRPHVIHIEARSGSRFIDYSDVDYTITDPLAVLVRPHEFTYADVVLKRNIDDTYCIVAYDPARNVNITWPPLPDQQAGTSTSAESPPPAPEQRGHDRA